MRKQAERIRGRWLKKEKRAFWLVFSLLILFSSLNLAVKKDLEIVLEGKKLEGLSSAGLTVNFVFRVSNSSLNEYRLIKTNTRTLINKEEFFRLETELETPISIPARQETLISLPVKITYDYLFQALPRIKDAERFTCNLAGWLTFVDLRRREQKVALAATADFPLFKDWEISFEPLEVKNLSLGGAELSFSVVLINKDNSTWILHFLRYRLELAGKEVAQELRTFQDSLGPGEKMRLAIPLLLDFFELGGELQSSLEAKEIEVFFSSEMEIESEWGKFRFPLVHRDRVAIVKHN